MIRRRYETDPEFPSAWFIAKESSGKLFIDQEKVGETALDLIVSVLSGLRYPAYLLADMLASIKIGSNLTRIRMGMINAILSQNEKEFDCMEEKSAAMRLGKLFGLMDRVQRRATNRTRSIQTTHLQPAMFNPALIFPYLLTQTAKYMQIISSPGYRRLIAEEVSNISAFPSALTIKERGEFLIGLYRQLLPLENETDQKGEEDNGEA
jgi:hypothetical protein